MFKVEDVTIIKAAYVVIMAQGTFPGRHRPEIQTLLCAMRDRIAEIEGRSSQDVQDEYQSMSMGTEGQAWAICNAMWEVGLMGKVIDG